MLERVAAVSQYAAVRFVAVAALDCAHCQLQPFKVGCLRQDFVTARPERFVPGDAEADSHGQQIGQERCRRRIQRGRAQFPEQPQRFRRCACLSRHWILFRISLIPSLRALSLPKDSETAISSKLLKNSGCLPPAPAKPCCHASLDGRSAPSKIALMQVDAWFCETAFGSDGMQLCRLCLRSHLIGLTVNFTADTISFHRQRMRRLLRKRWQPGSDPIARESAAHPCGAGNQ